MISISLLTPFAACSNEIWTVVSCAPPNPNGEKSSNGENPPLLPFDDSPKPFANSPKMFRNSSSGFTFALKLKHHNREFDYSVENRNNDRLSEQYICDNLPYIPI